MSEITWLEYPDTQPMDHQKVLISGGVAQYRDGKFYSGMEEPLFRREIQWNVTLWAELPFHTEKSNNDVVCECIDMDEWKHSRHNALDTYDNLLSAEHIIQGKIENRIVELGRLRLGLKSINTMKDKF